MSTTIEKRIKTFYENRTNFYLPRRTYTIIRVKGRSLEFLKKSSKNSCDTEFMYLMDTTAINLCKEIPGAQLGFVHRDEISILLTDFASEHTEAWMDGNVQKLASISGSLATKEFNAEYAKACKLENKELLKYEVFYSHVFTIPDRVEVANYFISCQQRGYQKSLLDIAFFYFSHEDIYRKSQKDVKKMLSEKNVELKLYDYIGFSTGRLVSYTQETKWVIAPAPELAISTVLPYIPEPQY